MLHSSPPKLTIPPNRVCSGFQAFAQAVPATCRLVNQVNSFFLCRLFSRKPTLITTRTGVSSRCSSSPRHKPLIKTGSKPVTVYTPVSPPIQ